MASISKTQERTTLLGRIAFQTNGLKNIKMSQDLQTIQFEFENVQATNRFASQLLLKNKEIYDNFTLDRTDRTQFFYLKSSVRYMGKDHNISESLDSLEKVPDPGLAQAIFVKFIDALKLIKNLTDDQNAKSHPYNFFIVI